MIEGEPRYDDSRESRAHRLTKVSRAFTYASSLKDILHLATDQAAELLGADKAILMLTDEQGLLRVRAAYGVSSEVVERFRESFDESLITRLKGLLGADSPDGFIGVPLVVGGNVIGLLAVVRTEDADAERYADDEWLLSALADQTAAPVENAQLTEALDRARLLAENSRLYEAERAARREAEVARMEAESANRAKSEFLANMSHELRTPLNAIAGYVELLDMEIRGPITPTQREDLARIKASQRMLLRLVNDVLNFAKLESGHVPLNFKEVGVNTVLAAVEPLVLPQLMAKGLRFRSEPCPEDVRVIADPEKLEQILLNLLSNAIKFTPAEGSIRLSCDADESTVSIIVADTGRGIPQEKQDRIFE
ncbi:MAG TPA: histidine kinase dimerization/phospho-acceptor domain-containing protein, partial [Gemmatimonadaceae bacterium]|nr:histidine kinase dimerization/phospho-acceptor domain-containing protein [Gemmatimonadaceae bacterium]